MINPIERTAVCPETCPLISREEAVKYDKIYTITTQDLHDMSYEQIQEVRGVVYLVNFQTKLIVAKFVDGKMI